MTSILETPPNIYWEAIHDKFYRKEEIYTMEWEDIILSRYRLAGAPYGGPIAMIRDDSKILTLNNNEVKSIMYFYTSAGKLIHKFQWTHGKIIGMQWTDTENFVTVLANGTVCIFDIHGEFSQFSLGKEAKDSGIIDCIIWGSGLVVMTRDYRLIAVNNLDEPRPKLLADANLTERPHSWIVLPPQFTLSRSLEVFLAVGNTILVVDISDVQDQLLGQGPFKKMSVSMDGKLLALFTEKGELWVISTDFQKNLSQYNTGSKVPPEQMVWCSGDTVLLHWPGYILMVGPFGDWIRYEFDSPLYLIPEIDGVRIITNEKCEFLQKVPESTESIFKIGSTDPGAILFDAYEQFVNKNPKADENIRMIKYELEEAVDTCIQAAGNEINIKTQKALLKAASFGKCFLEFYNSEKFVKMCQIIRVLNAIRFYEIGIPLTYVQYCRLTPEVLIDRLTNRYYHLLAIRICNYLKMNTERVVVHWACAKIKTFTDDEEILSKLIIDKLTSTNEGKPSLCYTEIAKEAYRSGMPKLATKLLDFESQAANQVPLLISMQEDELSLKKAIESGDTDLIYLVILHLHRKLPIAEFFKIINEKPLACNLLEVYCKQQNLPLLKDFYYQADFKSETAAILTNESYEETEVTSRIEKLKTAMRYYSEDKDRSFEVKSTDEHIRLLQIQEQLERETNQVFLELSLSETIFKCLIIGQVSRASKLRSEFRIPDKRFWWIKLKALVKTNDWDGLEKFSKQKSPIGYIPFIDECLKANAPQEASKYVEKCDADQRPALWQRIRGEQQQ